MKTKKSSLLILSLLLIMGAQANKGFAQDDLDIDDPLVSEDIDVDGQFKRESAGDKMAKIRKKVEKDNEDMMQKKIEDIRMDNEKKLTKQLRDAFRGKPIVTGDSVETSSAAVAKVEAKVEEPKKTTEFKIIPFFGVQSITNDSLELESKIYTGLNLEAMVSRNVSVGLGFSLVQMEMTNVGDAGAFGSGSYNGFYNTYGSNYGYNYNSLYNSFYNNGYYNAYGSQGRKIEYKNYTFEINSKYYMFAEKRIRPYLGLGVGYNRTNMSYSTQSNQSYGWNGYTLGNEEYASSYVSGSALLGAEVSFTENIGFSLDFRYTKGLTSGFDGETGQTFANNPDQEKLEKIGKGIEEANFFALTGGIVVSF